MKMTIGRDELARALELHAAHLWIADKENPRHYHLPMTVAGNTLSMHTTSIGTRGMCAQSEVPVSRSEDGHVAVKLWKLLKVVRTLKGREHIDLSYGDDFALTVRSGRSSWRLSASHLESTPKPMKVVGDIPEGSVAAAELERLVGGAMLAVDKNDYRYGLDVVEIEMFHEESEAPWIQAIGSNGSWLRLESTGEPKMESATREPLYRHRPLCIDAAKVLLKALRGFRGSWDLSRWTGIGRREGWRLSTSGFTILSCRSDVPTFPSWRDVICQPTPDRVIRVQRQDLLDALKRGASLYAIDDDCPTVALCSVNVTKSDYPDMLEVRTANGVVPGSELSTVALKDGADGFEESVPLEVILWKMDEIPQYGPAGFNLKLMIKALEALKKTSRHELVELPWAGGPLSPQLLMSNNSMTVVMPVRLD